MTRHVSRLIACALSVCLCVGPAFTQAASDEPGDPFMGDWEGTLRAADGTQRPLCAQVICWGRGEYQANLLDAFDRRVEPVAVLKGNLTDGAVLFGDGARIAEDAFTGELAGEAAGSFRLQHVVRPSPTLGAEPPPGAVVLFDGTNLDEWQDRGGRPWILDLGRAVGGSDCAVYLRSRLWSPRRQPASLELGSDDGVKAWLNGKLVHANNVNRSVTPWEDKADVELSEGWNVLMLMVVQIGGGWGACARVRAADGNDLDGIRFDPAPVLAEGTDLRSVQGDSAGTVVTWELAGPYTQEGTRGADLFEVSFPPEQADDAAVEWRVVNDRPTPARRWRLVEGGAMEIARGVGALVSTRQFRDHRLHLEFRTPFQPTARGQGRGNSGVYVHGRHEIQILDSYGLEGARNECGAIYGRAAPLVNMCAPPLQWQTFDVEFRTSRRTADEDRVEDATMTVYHNGVLIHDRVRIPSRSPDASGGILLQDHGSPVQFRNIWVVELPPE